MGPKKYPDLKYKFIRGLIANEQSQRSRHFLKSAAEWTSRAIVSLDLEDKPVKSVKQASQLEGIGGELCKRLKELQEKEIYSAEPPDAGKYCSSASAILAALLTVKKQMLAEAESQSDKCLIPESTVIAVASQMCEERFLAAEDENFKGLCPAWWRMQVLIGRGYVKKRSVKKGAVYDLLPPGEYLANQVLAKQELDAVPNVAGLQRAELARQQAEALYTNDTGEDGVVLCVDTQEWGGDRVGLGQLTQLLSRAGVRFRTRRLATGDYMWLWRHGGEDRTLPVLMERKRADDLARSIVDKRFERQLVKMCDWKQDFMDRGVQACIKYLVEGQPEEYVVACMDGCGGVLRCGYPTVEEVKEKIRELENHPEIDDVLRTDNIEGTVDLLALMSADLEYRIGQQEFIFEMLIATNTKTVTAAGPRKHKAHVPKKAKKTKTNDPAGPSTSKRRRKKKANNEEIPNPEAEQENVKQDVGSQDYFSWDGKIPVHLDPLPPPAFPQLGLKDEPDNTSITEKRKMEVPLKEESNTGELSKATHLDTDAVVPSMPEEPAKVCAPRVRKVLKLKIGPEKQFVESPSKPVESPSPSHGLSSHFVMSPSKVPDPPSRFPESPSKFMAFPPSYVMSLSKVLESPSKVSDPQSKVLEPKSKVPESPSVEKLAVWSPSNTKTIRQTPFNVKATPSPSKGKVYFMKRKNATPSPLKQRAKKLVLPPVVKPRIAETNLSETITTPILSSGDRTNPLYKVTLTPPEFFNVRLSDTESDHGETVENVLEYSEGLPDLENSPTMDFPEDMPSTSAVIPSTNQIAAPSHDQGAPAGLIPRRASTDSVNHAYLQDHIDMVRSVLPDADTESIVTVLKRHDLDIDLTVWELLDTGGDP